jgi:hypothetical protein
VRPVPQPTSGDEPTKIFYIENENVMFAYFAPGDFAVFDLRPRFVPPIPPLGPKKP